MVIGSVKVEISESPVASVVVEKANNAKRTEFGELNLPVHVDL